MGDWQVYAAGAGVAVVVLLLVLFVVRGGAARRERLRRRLEGEGRDEPGSFLLPGPPKNFDEKVDRYFDRLAKGTAGGFTGQQAVGIILMTGLVAAAGIWLWSENILYSAAGMFAAGLGVYFILRWLHARYLRTLQNQLPDVLFLLARSLRAGMSLEQAINLAAEQGGKPLADEFGQCAYHMRLGLSALAAVQLMADRLRLVDFNAFASTVALHQSVGGNLAMLLDRLAAGARDRNQFRNHLLVATALGRVTAIFLGGAAPALLLGYAIWQPDYIQAFFQSTNGLITVIIVFVLEIIGVIWLYNLLSVEI
jgi:tight adherence protein B